MSEQTRTAPQPGTEEFAAMLRRERELIAMDVADMKAAARRAAANGPLDHVGHTLAYTIEYTKVCNSEFGQLVAQAMARYNQRAAQHNEALRSTRQTAINQRAAAKTQAAACKSCFTVHNGDCY